jgi:hypothetical protein
VATHLPLSPWSAATSTKCAGTTNCDYYDKRCNDPKTGCKKYYCEVAPPICRNANHVLPTNFSNCVQLCLQQQDDCWQKPCGQDFDKCQIALHENCGLICGSQCF